MHWFNPPEWTPGIEIIPAPSTTRDTVDRAIAFLRAVGKRPAEVADRAGFVANRLQSALLREAIACVEEGLASPDDLDEVVRSTFGFRLPFFGPFAIADMAGLDVYKSVFETLERDVGPEFAPPAALREHVEAGRFGTKSGRGLPHLQRGRAGGAAARARPPLRGARRAARRARRPATRDRRGRPRRGRRRDRRRHGRQADRRGAPRRRARRDREHVERLRGDGLLLDDLGEERRVVLEACADPDELGERFDFALVTLKAAFHQAALPPLRERDVAESFVSLGNGLSRTASPTSSAASG